MDIEQARADIVTWLTDFVEKPNPMLNGWAPCPYARRARIDGLVDIRAGANDPVAELHSAEIGEYDVIAYVYDPEQISAEQLESAVEQLNQQHLKSRGLFALCDHPAAPEIVNGVVMNQGKWAIVFLQDLTKLNSFAQQLAKKGYYTDWPEDYLSGLFYGRKDPRT